MDEDTPPIGDYLCPNCGSMEIDDPSDVTVSYPLGLELPRATIRCSGCDKILTSYIQWEDAMVFEKRGAVIQGFSFLNSAVMTEQEIDDFVVNMDQEIKEFLDAASQ